MTSRRKIARDESPFGRAAAWLEGAVEPMLALQAELVRHNAVGPANGGPGEADKAAFLQAWLPSQGFPDPQRLDSDDNGVARPNLFTVVPGRDRTRCLWFMSHLDVVPAGDASLWKSDPFLLRVEGDKIVGRGVEDNHQGLVASTLAAKALMDLGIQPACDVGLLFVADEETGSVHGLQHLLLRHPGMFGPDDAFIVPDAGNEDGSLVEVAEKAILWFKVRTVGKQVHASTPGQGKNAMVAGSALVLKLRGLYDRFDLRDPLFDPPLSTFEPTRREENVGNVNTIPGEDVFYVDCRILPQIPVDDVLAQVRATCDEVARQYRVVVQVEVVQREDAAPPTPPDAPIVGRVVRAVRKVYNVDARPRGIGGGTVAAYLRRRGFPAVVWSRMDETAHQPNEYAWIPNLVGDAKVFADLMIGELEEVASPEA